MVRTTEFGRLIRDFRVSKDMSLRAVAEAIGVSHVYLGEVERGVKGPLAREWWGPLTRVLKGLTIKELESAALQSRPAQLRLGPEHADIAVALRRRIEEDGLGNIKTELLRLLRRGDQ